MSFTSARQQLESTLGATRRKEKKGERSGRVSDAAPRKGARERASALESVSVVESRRGTKS
jgi:hypothetical protein